MYDEEENQSRRYAIAISPREYSQLKNYLK